MDEGGGVLPSNHLIDVPCSIDQSRKHTSKFATGRVVIFIDTFLFGFLEQSYRWQLLDHESARISSDTFGLIYIRVAYEDG